MSESASPSFAFGRFRYGASEEIPGRPAKLLLDGREVALPPRELQLLAVFLHRPAQWLTEDELARGLWPNAVPPMGELDRLLRELTAALDRGADGVTTIQRVKGRGSRLLIPVRALGEPGASAGDGASPPPGAAAGEPAGEGVPAPAGGRSEHRRLLSPRRLAIALLVAGIVAAAMYWAVRAVSQGAGAGGVGPAAAVAAAGGGGEVAGGAPDRLAPRAAANAALAKGIAALRGNDLASRRVAIARFEAALALDPTLAPAHAALARALTLESESADERELERGRREALAALALDRRLADAHAALAIVQIFHDRDLVAARASAERALASNVAHVGARRALAWAFTVEGRFVEALAEIVPVRSATLFDPELATDEGTVLYFAGHALEARRLLSEVVRSEPLFRRAHATLAELDLADRRLGSAIAELELADALAAGATRDDERVQRSISGAWLPTDASEAARRLAERAENFHLHPQGGAPGSELEAARIFARFGDADLALAALARALAQRENGAIFARVDPAFASLRGSAAFRDLLERSRVPPLARPGSLP